MLPLFYMLVPTNVTNLFPNLGPYSAIFMPFLICYLKSYKIKYSPHLATLPPSHDQLLHFDTIFKSIYKSVNTIFVC